MSSKPNIVAPAGWRDGVGPHRRTVVSTGTSRQPLPLSRRRDADTEPVHKPAAEPACDKHRFRLHALPVHTVQTRNRNVPTASRPCPRTSTAGNCRPLR